MSTSYLRQLQEVIEIYHLDRFREVQPLVAQLQYGRVSEWQARGWMWTLQPIIQKQLEFPNLLPPPPDDEQLLHAGPFDFEIATLCEDPELRSGLHILRQPQHTLVAGMTRYGKSVTLKTIIVRLCEAARKAGRFVCILVFDRKGGDFKDLCRLFPELFFHFSVHEGLRFGLNAPEGVPVRVWASIVSTIIAARCNLKFSASTLARMIEWLVAVLNPEPTDRPLWPDLQLIVEVAERSPATLFAEKGDYDRSMIHQLKGIVQASGELLRTFRGLDVEHDLVRKGRGAVFEMSNLEPPYFSYVFVDLVIEQILAGRKHRQQKTAAGTEILLVVDEAEVDISRGSEAAYPNGLFPLSKWLGQAGEFGGSTLLAPKILGPASPLIMGSIENHIFLRQEDHASITVAANTLMLPPGAEGMLRKLERGQAIVRTGEGWKDPFLAQIDFTPPCHTPKTTPYDTHDFVPAQPLSELPHVNQALSEFIAQHQARKARQAKASKKKLSAKAEEFLACAAGHPFTPVARLWKLVGSATPPKQLAVRKELLRDKCAVFDKVRIGSAEVALVAVTEEGWQYLQTDPPALRGRGGIVHRHFAHWIAMVGRQRGYRSEVEFYLPDLNYATDAAWLVDGLWRVFEVGVTETKNLPSHLDACLRQSKSVTDVTIVTSQKSTSDEIRLQLSSHLLASTLLDRVSFESISTYKEELWT